MYYPDSNQTSQLGTLPFRITQNLNNGVLMAGDENSLIQDLAYDYNGAVGRAYELNGNDNAVDLGIAPALSQNLDSFAYSAWVRLDVPLDSKGTYRYLFDILGCLEEVKGTR